MYAASAKVPKLDEGTAMTTASVAPKNWVVWWIANSERARAARPAGFQNSASLVPPSAAGA